MSNKRGGVAAVEAAVTLPLVILIFLGCLEMSMAVFHEYDAQAATYELSKMALRTGSSTDEVQSLAGQILPPLGFDSYNITIDVENRTVNADSVEPATETSFLVPQTGTPTAGLEFTPRGTLLRLTLTAERPTVSGLNLFRNFTSNQIVTDCVFVKEF